MFRANYINGSVQWLGVSSPPRTDVPTWTDNILAPSPARGTDGTDTNPNCQSHPGGPYDSVVVPWSCPIRSMLAYVGRIPENMRSSARRIYDDIQ